jgi:hypothetical protein
MRAAILQRGDLAGQGAEQDDRITDDGACQGLALTDFFGPRRDIPGVSDEHRLLSR